jgi:predicted Zn-dependent protease
VLNESDCKRIIDRAISASTADEVHVAVSSEHTSHLRFARNSPSTSGTYANVTLSVRSVLGSRSGSVTVNQIDDEAIATAVARAEEIACLAPEDPEHVAALPPQTYVEVDSFHGSVLDRGIRQMAEGVSVCLRDAVDRGLSAAGFVSADASAEAIGNSRGLFGFHRWTRAHVSETVRTDGGDGSGWAAAVGDAVDRLDFAKVSATAMDKAVRSARPRALPPGKYVTILEPACVAELVQSLVFDLRARSADEGRSFFSRPDGGNRRGERLFPEAVSIYSDPTDVEVPGRSWDDDGLPQVRRDWIREGTLANLLYDRFWAEKQGVAPIPRPSNVIMAGGTGTVADLIRTTERGVLITSLWYIRSVDPRTMLMTGLTRDGVFWIEDGEIAYPVTNFRWNDSPVRVLKGIEAMSSAVRVSPRSWASSTVKVPALRVREFELSSVSEAV